MDKTTAGGLAGVWGLVALAIILGGAGFGAYVDIPSVIIVFGGTAAVTMGQYEGADLGRLGKALGVAMNESVVEPLDQLAEKLTMYATEIKKNGAMSIEVKLQEETNLFFKEAFNLIVDNTKPELIEDLLDTKMEQMENRHKTMIAMLGSMGGSAGAMGMIGTLVGLVAMLANLSDPSSVGPAMAVALLTTMYGALIGTGFAGIFENKLSEKHSKEMIAYQIIAKVVFMISSEKSVGDVKSVLRAILPDQEE